MFYFTKGEKKNGIARPFAIGVCISLCVYMFKAGLLLWFGPFGWGLFVLAPFIMLRALDSPGVA